MCVYFSVKVKGDNPSTFTDPLKRAGGKRNTSYPIITFRSWRRIRSSTKSTAVAPLANHILGVTSALTYACSGFCNFRILQELKASRVLVNDHECASMPPLLFIVCSQHRAKCLRHLLCSVRLKRNTKFFGLLYRFIPFKIIVFIIFRRYNQIEQMAACTNKISLCVSKADLKWKRPSLCKKKVNRPLPLCCRRNWILNWKYRKF